MKQHIGTFLSTWQTCNSGLRLKEVYQIVYVENNGFLIFCYGQFSFHVYPDLQALLIHYFMLLWNFIFKFSFNLCAFLFYSNIIGFNEKFQDPMISKMILSACSFGCSEEIITIAAVLSVQVIFCSFNVNYCPVKGA